MFVARPVRSQAFHFCFCFLPHPALAFHRHTDRTRGVELSYHRRSGRLSAYSALVQLEYIENEVSGADGEGFCFNVSHRKKKNSRTAALGLLG